MTPPIETHDKQVLPVAIVKSLRLLIGLTGLVLLWQTGPLWFGAASFPQVPLLELFAACPYWCDGLAGGLMVLSLATVLAMPGPHRIARVAGLVFAAGFVFAVLLNQHRLQPWAFEFCILLLVMSILPDAKAVWCLRWIVASIYFHSGLSKLDVTFLTTHGEVFVSVIADAVGWDFASAPAALRRLLVALLPVGEIAVAVGLLLPKTRRLAVGLSIGMHLLLIGILGPWGLGHQPGVLIWNLYFIAQNLLLFRSGPRVEFEEQSPTSQPKAQIGGSIFVGYVFAALVVLLPFLEPLGWYDHWPAWAVYASRPERVRVYIAENRAADLPANVREFVTDEQPAGAGQRFLAGKPALKRLLIDRWSLEVLGAPVYPQDRFQIGVALALAQKFGWEDDLRVEIDSPADRWTGKRTTRSFEGAAAIRQAAREFFFNALPRQPSL